MVANRQPSFFYSAPNGWNLLLRYNKIHKSVAAICICASKFLILFRLPKIETLSYEYKWVSRQESIRKDCYPLCLGHNRASLRSYPVFFVCRRSVSVFAAGGFLLQAASFNAIWLADSVHAFCLSCSNGFCHGQIVGKTTSTARCQQL